MALRGRGNDNVAESRRMALAACQIRQGTDNTRYGHIERQDTGVIETPPASSQAARSALLHLAPSRRSLVMPSSISATVTAEINSNAECISIQLTQQRRIQRDITIRDPQSITGHHRVDAPGLGLNERWICHQRQRQVASPRIRRCRDTKLANDRDGILMSSEPRTAEKFESLLANGWAVIDQLILCWATNARC